MTECAVIFGGTGFIGSFFAHHLLTRNIVSRVYLFDLDSISDKPFPIRNELLSDLPNLTYIQGDVRNAIEWVPEEPVDLIANFAAIHREPGHADSEYFDTNIKGAENICTWAEKVHCKDIIFTSSISAYGPGETEKTENSLTVPTSPYGCSKLVAEKIHQIWLAHDRKNRNLVIVRPGVVFGPGEGGNVTRLIRSVLKGYFFYIGNRNTRKSGVYVKELCNAMLWALNQQKLQNRHFTLFNMSMNPGPSIQEYVETVCNVSGVHRLILSAPFIFILASAYLIDFVAQVFRIHHPFKPLRVKKLTMTNNIIPKLLLENGYKYKYTLTEAFEDWRKISPDEWCD